MSRQAYTHYRVQGCLGRPPVSVAPQGRTLSTATCPGAPATPPRYGQGCPLPCPANFGGWAKTGHPVHASTHAAARHTPGWCTGPGYPPGCPGVGGFSITEPLPPPCVCRRKIRAFVADPRTCQVCAWLVANPRLPPAGRGLSSRETRHPAAPVCRVFVCISLAAPGWGIPVGQL